MTDSTMSEFVMHITIVPMCTTVLYATLCAYFFRSVIIVPVDVWLSYIGGGVAAQLSILLYALGEDQLTVYMTEAERFNWLMIKLPIVSVVVSLVAVAIVFFILALLISYTQAAFASVMENVRRSRA